jgi:hypothetical protein
MAAADGEAYPDRFPREVDEVIRRSGWYPGRSVDVDRWRTGPGSEVSMHPAAERFLSELGDLSVDVNGDGVDVGRDPFEFDPMDELGELGDEGRYAGWGRTSTARCFLLVPSSGRCSVWRSTRTRSPTS